MAQETTTSPGLNVFLSIVQSLNSDLTQSTAVSSTFATSTTASTLSTAPTTSATFASSTSSPSLTSTAAPTTTVSAASATGSSGLSTTARNAVIIVCSVVGALLLALLGLGIWFCIRRRRRRRGDPIGKPATKEIGTPLRADDWYHDKNSHHGYVGGQSASISQAEMAQQQSKDKNPRHSISQLPDDEVPPNIDDHPAFAREAFARDSDPYKAAGVGSAGLAGPAAAGAAISGAAASRQSGEETPRRSMAERRSLGERRLSDHMPARKPVGSPPSMPGRIRTSNPLKIDTGASYLGSAAKDAGIGALAGGAAHHHRQSQSPPYKRHSGSTDRLASPCGQHPEPTATSPLSSHPSNPLLVNNTSRKHDSYHSQRSINDAVQPSSTQPDLKGKGKRPPTPLGFDFGLPKPDDSEIDDSYHAAESEPFASGFEPQVLTAPVSKYSSSNITKNYNTIPNPRHSGIANPTADQRASLDRRNQHYMDNEPVDYAPDVPQRSPRRLSRGSFDEAQPQATGAASALGETDIALPPRSPKRMSWNRSRESIIGTPNLGTQPRANDVFRDSGDFAYSNYPSPRSRQSGSLRAGNGSPRLGPAPGHRSDPIRTVYNRSSVPTPDTGSQGQLNSPYSPGRSQAFAQNAGYPVYGTNDSGAASSVESWVSARAQPMPPPWDDNAIRRNSSSGQLRRPKSLLQNQHDSESSQGEGTVKRTRDSRHADSGQFSAGPPGRASGSPGKQRLSGQGFEGYGGYDPSWGEGNIEKSVFDKHGYQRSRNRRSSSGSGFDPRYGRWTDSTYADEFGHETGVGEAL